MINNSKTYAYVIFIFILPIILANQFYVDDIGRATVGYTKWGVDGRPVADIVMSVLNLSSRMVDLAPLPIILAAVLLAISFACYRKRFLDGGKWSFIVPLAFMANPAIISMFSYRFDVLTFSFSIASAFALFAIKCKKLVHEFIIGTAFVVIVLGTYQAVINVVAILLICEVIVNMARFTDPQLILKRVALRIMQVLVGGVIYVKFILPITFSGHYSSNHPRISNDILGALKNNSLKYYDFASTNFYRVIGGELLLLSALACIIMTAFLSYKYVKCKGLNWEVFNVITGAILATAIAMPMTMGALLVLANPLGGVHLYMSVGVFYVLMSTLLYYCFKEHRYVTSITLIPVLYSMILMYAYGNALKAQERINKVVLSEIMQSIRDAGSDNVSIVFTGTAPRSEAVKNAALNFPLINYSVTDYFWNWYWGSAYMSFNGIKNTYMPANKAKNYISHKCEGNLSFQGQWLNSYIKDSVLIVDFDKKSCQ